MHRRWFALTPVIATVVFAAPAQAQTNLGTVPPNTQEVVQSGSTKYVLTNTDHPVSAADNAAADAVLVKANAAPQSLGVTPGILPDAAPGLAGQAASVSEVRVLSVRHLAGWKPTKHRAHTSGYIGNHEWYGVGIRTCDSWGCWFMSQTSYAYRLWYNGQESWVGGGAYMDPYHCSSVGSCTIHGTWWTGWNPAWYGYGRYLGAHTAWNVSIAGSFGASGDYWSEMHFYGDGYVSYLHS